MYVDGDGLVLLESRVAPFLASSVLLFLVALRVPLSWEKIHLGPIATWIGWKLDWHLYTAHMPDAKRSKLHEMLLQLVSPGKRVEKKLIEQCVGLLLWYCGGAYWLKPWLSELCKLLHKLALVFRSLSASHFGAMVASFAIM